MIIRWHLPHLKLKNWTAQALMRACLHSSNQTRTKARFNTTSLIRSFLEPDGWFGTQCSPPSANGQCIAICISLNVWILKPIFQCFRCSQQISRPRLHLQLTILCLLKQSEKLRPQLSGHLGNVIFLYSDYYWLCNNYPSYGFSLAMILSTYWLNGKWTGTYVRPSD